MGSPAPEARNDALYDWAGLTIQKAVRERFPAKTTILDVGAGWGKYRLLLPEYPMDACEIWKPYIESEKLDTIYDRVFESDICDLKFKHYDVIIFGDVFEHIDRDRAKKMLEYIWDKCDEVYIAVPWLYVQDGVEGNPYEEHKQADLTEELMEREYPQLKLLSRTDEKGIYVKRT